MVQSLTAGNIGYRSIYSKMTAHYHQIRQLHFTKNLLCGNCFIYTFHHLDCCYCFQPHHGNANYIDTYRQTKSTTRLLQTLPLQLPKLASLRTTTRRRYIIMIRPAPSPPPQRRKESATNLPFLKFSGQGWCQC